MVFTTVHNDKCEGGWLGEIGFVYLQGKNKGYMATKLKQYMFTFEGGGWNTVWAKSLPGARKQAIAEYKDSSTLNPIPSSVHLATDDGLRNALSLFY